MSDFIREAGWPIYPVLALGLSGIAVAVRHALVPQRSLRPLAGGLLAAAVIMGLLGFVVGYQHSVRGIEDGSPDVRWLVLVGSREALNCLVGGLSCALVGALALTVGSYKMARRLEEVARRDLSPAP